MRKVGVDVDYWYKRFSSTDVNFCEFRRQTQWTLSQLKFRAGSLVRTFFSDFTFLDIYFDTLRALHDFDLDGWGGGGGATFLTVCPHVSEVGYVRYSEKERGLRGLHVSCQVLSVVIRW